MQCFRLINNTALEGNVVAKNSISGVAVNHSWVE